MPRKEPRNYKKEYAEYHGTNTQKKNRALRNKARKAAEKRLGKNKLRGMEVDHIKPLSKGGSGNLSNTRVISKKANRRKQNKTR